MTLVVEILRLVFCWYVVDADLALLDRLADAEQPHGHVLRASIVGPVLDDKKSRSVVNEQLNNLEVILEPHLCHLRHRVREEHDSLHC